MKHNFKVGDEVLVNPSVTGHEFVATVSRIYGEGNPKHGLILVKDQEDDGFDVEPDEIELNNDEDSE